METQSSHLFDVSQVGWRLLNRLEASVVALHESVNLLAVVLSVEVADVLVLLVNDVLHFVLLNVEVGCVLVFNNVVVVQRQNSVVNRGRKLGPMLNIVLHQRLLVQGASLHLLTVGHVYGCAVN